MHVRFWILSAIVSLNYAASILGPIRPPIFPRLYPNPGLYPMVPGKPLTIHDPISGIVRPISYHVDDLGLAIYDGDVIFGTEAKLLANAAGVKKRELDPDSNQLISQRSYSINIPYPDGVIPFFFNTANDQATLAQRVTVAQGRWRKVAPYLLFNDLGVGNPNKKFGINITSQFSGCVTNAAAEFKYFAPFAMNLNATNCDADTAVHEFGHTLGLIHEHQRPDASSKVKFLCQNLAPLCPAGVTMPPGTNCCNVGLPTGCCANVNQFTVISGAGYDYSTPYDIKSVMQYVGAAFANPGTLTLQVVNPAVDTLSPSINPSDPSPGDTERVCKIYRSICPRAIDCVNQECGSRCTHPISACTGAASCGSRTPPACCDVEAASECKDQNRKCQNNGCTFLW